MHFKSHLVNYLNILVIVRLSKTNQLGNPVIKKLVWPILFTSPVLISYKNKDAAKSINNSSKSLECPKYDRSDYSHWIDAYGDCQDPCVEVLVAENFGTISYLTTSSCKMVTGSTNLKA